MTFTDMVSRVADRLNLTSAAALSRIGQELNERYREVLTGVGLESAASGISVATANTIVGIRTVTFTGVEKLFSVFNPNFTPPVVLDEFTFDELRNQPIGTDPARRYAIQGMGAATVTIFLDTVPSTIYSLNADAEMTVLDLSGVMEPAFSRSFHDLLVEGAIADELYKLEKYDLSEVKEKNFEKRLSELRYFIAKSAYNDMYQAKDSPLGVQNRLV
jgi:hypothetical protein